MIAETDVRLEIDGRAVVVPGGTSVLRAAESAGIVIPKLCDTQGVEPSGACRLCLVEVEGVGGTPASCTLSVADGMVVRTQSERLQNARRGILELTLSRHPVECDTCPKNGDCQLQDVVRMVGLGESGGWKGVVPIRSEARVDDSNPYFHFDPAYCIHCDLCVRVCAEVQGTFALSGAGRGAESRVVAGDDEGFMGSGCVSCGACVAVCPTAALMEKTVIASGLPDRVVHTTCAYCGVGCSLRAELRGDDLVRMVPDHGGANAGHACVKGRFAWGWVSHPDRVTTPLVRDHPADPWRETDWDTAIAFTARRLREIQDMYGRKSIAGISSSRTTNEEVYVVQRLVRAAFGNNNIDTCARVCHAPTGYGLDQTFGTSAGTQDFASVDAADVILVIGANITAAHPVFAARLKRRVRAGAKLIVIDPRRIELVRGPHIEAAHYLQIRPGTNVAVANAIAHTILTEGLVNEDFVSACCEGFDEWAQFVLRTENNPDVVAPLAGVSADDLRAVARAYAAGPNSAIYYGLGVTEHTQGSTMVMALANLAMATGNIGRDGVGVNPLRGQNNVQGASDLGSFPHQLPGYRPVSDDAVRAIFESRWGTVLDPEPGLRLPAMVAAANARELKGMFIQGEDIAQSDPDTAAVVSALESLDLLVVMDLFLNETSRFAHVFLPGTTFLEKDGTFTNAERRLNRVRPAFPPRTGKFEWQVVAEIARAMGHEMRYVGPEDIMAEIAATTPEFAGVSYELIDRLGSVQWPCNEQAPAGTRLMHVDGFVRGRGGFMVTQFVPTPEQVSPAYPLILTTGRTLMQYNAGTQTRRTANTQWYDADRLEISPADAASRGIADGDEVHMTSRIGATTTLARVTDRVPPGVVYTTFHFRASGTNVVTTDNADWATSCPEFKVTAVQVSRASAE